MPPSVQKKQPIPKMSLKLLINYDRSILDKLYIADVSPYPVGGVNMSDVKQVRFLFATYNSLQSSGEANTIKYGYQYTLKGSGNITINGRTLSAGSTFILMNDVTPTLPSGLTLETTGYFAPYSTYLPTGADAEFTPTQTGEEGGLLYFPDAVRYIKYEIYDNEQTAGSITVSTPTTFIVKGVQNDSITIGGETYYVGEVFTKNSNFTFANAGGNVGTCTICKLADEVEVVTWTDKYAYATYENYVSKVADGNWETSNLIGNYLKVYSLLNTLYLGAETQANVDYENMQGALDIINSYYAVSKMM